MSAAQLRLGPYALHTPLARGGMGEVWRGEHVSERAPVAIKVLRVREPALVEALRHEIRAAAGLSHPNIAPVLDATEVDDELAEASQGALIAGSPALVMPYYPAGTIAPRVGRAEAPELLSLLAGVLSGLAHAHARGVLHRDLKPSNVVLDGEVPRLVDFGIARLGGLRGAGSSAGTPAYMAPEQWLGQERLQGPWTDLYALGCMAWELVTGAPPFGRAHPSHLTLPLPAFRPVVAVPAALEGWLRRCLEKRPEARFARAADARVALDGCETGVSFGAMYTHTAVSSAQDATHNDTWTDLGGDEDAPRAPAPRASAPMAIAPPPVPESWAGLEADPPRWLPGAGQRLYGLRALPLIDREVLRDALWAALREATQGATTAVVLRGPAGTGKSRLGRWLCETAHAAGAAEIWEARHDPQRGPSHGLGPMVARALGAEDLRGQTLLDQVRHAAGRLGVHDGGQLRALAELAAPGALPEDLQVRFGAPAARYAAIHQALQAGTRASVVWLDDVQWSADTLEFAAWMLRARPARTLLVLTAREEALSPEARAALEAVARRPGVRSLEVTALPAPDHNRLVGALLGLDSELRWQIEARTAGNPLFAVQLVGDWVRRGLLVGGARGFEARQGVSLELPDDLHAVWARSVEDILRGGDSCDRQALELAATLGLDINPAEWVQVCADAGFEAPWALVARLQEARLATVRPDGARRGWALVHGMLRESVLRLAGERAAEHHRRCATMLALRQDHELSERVARHWLAAGLAAEAAEPLRHAAHVAERNGHVPHAMALLDEREDIVAALGVPETDEHRLLAWSHRATLDAYASHLDLARAGAERVLARVGPESPAPLRAAVYVDAGVVLHRLGRWADAREALERGRAAALEAGDPVRAGDASWQLGWTLGNLGLSDEAESAFHRALDDYGDRPAARANALQSLASLANSHGRPAAAEALLAECVALRQKLGNQMRLDIATTYLANTRRLLGRPAEAEALLRPALERLVALEVGMMAQAARIYLAVAVGAQGRYADAWPVADEARDIATRACDGLRVAAYATVLMWLAAGQGDWSRYDAETAPLDALARSGWVDWDMAWCLSQAAKLAHAAGHADRARIAAMAAIPQWRGIHREDQAAELEALVAGL